jgi:hypothetical protein
LRGLERYSERYQPTGGLAAEGVLNQLGRPDIEPLEVLVREAVQNCWDAGLDGGPVEVEFGFRGSAESLSTCLRERVLPDPPPGHPLAACLEGGPDLLYIADFGTSGLGGPTRADAELDGESDFIDFVRNVGQPPDKEFGGGSFGYGKAAFYLASRASTIVIDTYCSSERERRLIAYALGDHYRDEGSSFTGRHWWGVPVDGVPEPLLGEEAAELSAALGLPARDGERFGTTVAIVSPDLRAARHEESLDSEEALEFIGQCLLWNFWPKITAAPGGNPAMAFRLLDGERELPLADPRAHSRLAPFVGAMDLLREAREVPAGDPFSSLTEIRSQRPARRLGGLAVRQTATASEIPDPDELVTRGELATSGGLHHVALMRKAELVVRYEPGPVYPVSGRGYAGVFRCDPELDEVFRRSEPPTHDAWVSNSLPERHERIFVRVAMRRIDGVLREMTTPAADFASASGAGVPVGRFADQLAGLMPGLAGPGARRSVTATVADGAGGSDAAGGQAGGGAGGGDGLGDGGGTRQLDGTAEGPRILEVGASELVVDDDDLVRIRTPFSIDTAGAPTRLNAAVEVLTMDGGQVETEPPIDGAVPEVLMWKSPEREIRDVAAVSAGATESGEWEVWIGYEPDLMIRIAIDVGPEEPA